MNFGPRVDPLALGRCLPNHRKIVHHALSVHLETMAQVPKQEENLLPLWLQLAANGGGLRAMTPDYLHSSDRLFQFFGLPRLDQILAQSSVKTRTLFRLAQFDLIRRQQFDQSDFEEKEIRSKLDLQKISCETDVLTIVSQWPDNPAVQATLAALSLARTIRDRRTGPVALVEIVESWILKTQDRVSELNQENLLRYVLAYNALTLFYLQQNKTEQVIEILDRLQAVDFRLIVNEFIRSHVNGNCHYQRSMICRMNGDLSGEIDQLVLAATEDRYFTSIYYRLAQILHDQADPRAKTMYEIALMLSPMDWPTANDYGCFLNDFNLTSDLESWSNLCLAFFPQTEGLSQ